MREVWRAAGHTLRSLTDEELNAAADAMLEGCGPGDPWVFAYGSLIWNPLLHFAEQRCATLRGYHRKFCLWSVASRGTRERPGLVLGLEHGGYCRGIALRIERSRARDEFRLLWKREMLGNSYRPRWVPLTTARGRLRAVTFVVNRGHPNYAGKLSLDDIVAVMSSACGVIGTSRDYLHRTIQGLREHGISDTLLNDIQVRLASQGYAGRSGHRIGPRLR